jgi:hypothetical protein
MKTMGFAFAVLDAVQPVASVTNTLIWPTPEASGGGMGWDALPSASFGIVMYSIP